MFYLISIKINYYYYYLIKAVASRTAHTTPYD